MRRLEPLGRGFAGRDGSGGGRRDLGGRVSWGSSCLEDRGEDVPPNSLLMYFPIERWVMGSQELSLFSNQPRKCSHIPAYSSGT